MRLSKYMYFYGYRKRIKSGVIRSLNLFYVCFELIDNVFSFVLFCVFTSFLYAEHVLLLLSEKVF